MRTRAADVTAQWALWGKAPGSGEDYQVLQTSHGVLSQDDFAETISKFGTGTDEPLPQLTMSWMRAGETLHLGVAIQEWSGDADHARRQIARTRYFAVPYGQVTGRPVSYEGLLRAFAPHRPPIADPLEVRVATLKGASIAMALTEATMEATALLLTGRPLCFLGGEDLDLQARVRALDAVAALLPYGLRAGLSASTWASGSVMHHIRLSFTDFAGKNANAVTFHGPSQSAHSELSRRYLNLLYTCPDRAGLIDRLAAVTDPLSFGHPDDLRYALRVLEEHCFPPVTHRPMDALQEAEPASLDELLTSIVDCLEDHGPADDLDAYVRAFWNLGEEIAQDERHRGRDVIRKRRLLTERFRLHPDLRLRMVTVAYGSPLTSDAIEQLARDAGPMTPDLLTTLRDMEMADHVATVLLAAHDEAHQETILNPLTIEDLSDAADGPPFIADVTRQVLEELYIRGTSEPNTAAVIADALHERNYLVDAVGALHQNGDDQVNCFCALLTAAYGKRLTEAGLERVAGHPAARASGALLIAAVLNHGKGAGEPLARALLQGAAEHIGLAEDRRDKTLALLATASPLDRPEPHAGSVEAVPVQNPRTGPLAPAADVPPETASPTRQWSRRLASVKRDTWLAAFIIGVALLVTAGALYYFAHRTPSAPARQPAQVPTSQQTRQAPVGASPQGTPSPSERIRDRKVRTPG